MSFAETGGESMDRLKKAYSRVTNSERFQHLRAAAMTLLDRLGELAFQYDATHHRGR